MAYFFCYGQRRFWGQRTASGNLKGVKSGVVVVLASVGRGRRIPLGGASVETLLCETRSVLTGSLEGNGCCHSFFIVYFGGGATMGGMIWERVNGEAGLVFTNHVVPLGKKHLHQEGVVWGVALHVLEVQEVLASLGHVP